MKIFFVVSLLLGSTYVQSSDESYSSSSNELRPCRRPESRPIIDKIPVLEYEFTKMQKIALLNKIENGVEENPILTNHFTGSILTRDFLDLIKYGKPSIHHRGTMTDGKPFTLYTVSFFEENGKKDLHLTALDNSFKKKSIEEAIKTLLKSRNGILTVPKRKRAGF